MTASVKYSNERLMTVLLAPVVSEKGTRIADKHEQVIFKVDPRATKPEVKAAVELMFSKKDKPIEVTIARLAKCGYDAIEISGEPERYDTKYVRKLLNDNKLTCWGSVTLMLADRDLRLRPARKSCEAQDFGPKRHVRS